MNPDSVHFITGYLNSTTEDNRNPAFMLNSMPASLIGCDPRTLPIKIKKSTSSTGEVIGFGVFAKKEIPADTFITFYPIHMSYKKYKDGTISRTYDHNVYSNDPFTDKEHFELLNKSYRTLVGDFDEYEQYDIADPCVVNFSRQLHLVGHMINDAYPNINDIIAPTEDEDEIIHHWLHYELRTNAIANCEYGACGRIWVIKSTKQIQPEEELLVKYGFSYWAQPPKSIKYLRSVLHKNIDKNPLIRKILGEYVD